MKYAVHKYDQDLEIEADYFRLVSGHREVPGSFGHGGSVHEWQDVVFYRHGDENPVAFVHQPYSVKEVTDVPEDHA